MLLLLPVLCSAQDISLYEQFNGRYDFVFVGNTMNTAENNGNAFCFALTESAATLNLNSSDQIESAYLYWAGSGTGDFDVKLNGTDISATRTFEYIHWNFGYEYFSAFADVTSLVQATGNGLYTLSELDINPFLMPDKYCDNRTNFAGWTLVVVYKNDAFPLNQLNVYDGLQGVPLVIDIYLNNLNVIDNVGARIGFVAWEGDKDPNIAINETLSVNGNPISNPPLNPVNNAFNGTNSFTGANNLYNMDLDAYNIQGNINIGDTSAHVQLTSGQQNPNGTISGDFVMINVVVTKLNSQLPDATVTAEPPVPECNSRVITLDYTVFNTASTDVLPAATPVTIYADGIACGTVYTQNDIPIDGSETGQTIITIPAGVPDTFTLTLVADDDGTTGIVTEIDENNNSFGLSVTLLPLPEINQPQNLLACNEGLTSGTFDFSEVADSVVTNQNQSVQFFESQADAESNSNPILDYSNYHANDTPHTIYIRIQDDPCYNTASFELNIHNCPPTVYNFISVNGDGKNDTFIIKGLYDIFLNFQLSIYNRWGAEIWKGNNSSGKWDGQGNEGIRLDHEKVPDGTYYYILELNDPDYPKPLNGFLYITH
ncbi:T9SS type B sorting domain-containing protein [Flavobacterium sp. SE-s28]|uniref:T9SS type B sorting domain-containing protein n=2 Tax=Flavobacterium silvaticum TaxID=1852020 RepID=A0A972JGA7_9FLAO|nr:T9SS type B sorting domain-containing protein [Flavobacterium silvaticum]